LPDVIHVRQLIKTYRYHRQQPGVLGSIRSLIHRESLTREAVKGIDLAVAPGEIVGLLGPNGAGKTTTLKMLTGLLRPSAGDVSVLGYEPWQRDTEFLRRIALVMGQKSMLWWEVSAMESLLLHKDMYGLSDEDFHRSVDELTTLLDVGDLLDIQVRRLSLGERMKLELLVALLHEPDVLFLDEPTIGLDVVAKARVRGFLADVNRVRGTTIVLTSHDMDDIEALCERVIILTHGEIAFAGDLGTLVARARPRKRVRVTYGTAVERAAAIASLGAGVEVTVDPESDAVLLIEVPRETLGETLELLPRLGPLVDLDVTDAEVEEIIRDLFTAEAVSL
jgi:ABC-2 type transport system ATP-binding protein